MKIAALVLFCVVCASCGSGDQPVPYKPDLPYKPVKTAENRNHPGFGAYMRTCHQCHQQADPATLSKEKWQMTVPQMSKHAGISEKEGELVLSYILSVREEGMR